MMIAKALAKSAGSSLVLMVLLANGETTSAPDVGDRAGEECLVVQGRGLPLQVQLNNGVSVPRIGFGSAGLGHATDEAASLALKAGYRHIDTAQAPEWYREDAVGRAVRQATSAGTNPLSSNGGETLDAVEAEEGAAHGSGRTEEVEATRPESGGATLSREHVFVTTKIHPRDFDAERIRAVVATSNTNLQGVDLLLLHAPFCWPGSCPDNPTPWQDAWRELEKIYSTGAVRAIGVSNFSTPLLRELLMLATVVPAAVQNWMDPFHQDKEVRALCAEHGIAYIAYSTLGGQWAYRPSSSSSANPLSADPTLGAIASAHGTSVQAVALSWALQSGVMILPRSSNPDRIRENLRLFVDDAGDGSSSARDRATRPSADGAGIGQGCRIGESGGGQVVEVFLTDDEVRAIERLDGTIGS